MIREQAGSMIREKDIATGGKLGSSSGLGREDGVVGWILVLIVLGVIFAIWLVIKLLQAIF